MDQTLLTLANLKTKFFKGCTDQIINHLVNSGCISEDDVQEHYAQILSIISLGKADSNIISSGKKLRRKKKNKDPNAPKRPASSFFLFKSAKIQEIKDNLADEGVEITVTTIASKAGEMWRAMSDEDKKPYTDEYNKKNITYKEELATYKSSNPIHEDEYEVVKTKNKRSKHKIKVAPCPTVIPEEFVGEWLGPFENTFLRGSIKGISFSNLNDAIVAANEREDCVGVTRSNRGYYVRFGYKDERPEFQGTGNEGFEDLLYPSPNKETSFIKKSAADDYAANGPNEKLTSSSDESVKKTTKTITQSKNKKKTKSTQPSEVSDSTQGKKKILKKKKKHSKKKPSVQLDHESDTDTDIDIVVETNIVADTAPVEDEGEVEVIKLTKITIDGHKYLINSKNDKVFSTKTHTFCGKLENGIINFDAVDSSADEFSDDE